ncbi:unnamed protein product [Paramecium sonneborni]|uniref:Uncharacterized protein n=1 Tax=Paramecium sonneborni TaxID=65129 RepID=A0A8S1Q242_9CILI|nr:unnamed protein product [Paramecium sonneborni]
MIGLQYCLLISIIFYFHCPLNLKIAQNSYLNNEIQSKRIHNRIVDFIQ